MSSILAIHAHPDDIEILAAGTLAVLAAAGHAVTLVTLTAGEGGATDKGASETAALRMREAAASAALIGARYRCGEVGDLAVFNDDHTRRRTTELIRWARPDVVIAPSPVDYHPDHEAVSLLARDACFAASVPNYRCGASPALPAIPTLYFCDPIGGRDREGAWTKADFGVDITATLETKKAMLTCHESQRAWVARQHDTADPIAAMVAWSARRGRDFELGFAEGFRHYRHHPYPAAPLLQDLVGEALAAGSTGVDV